MADQKQLFSRLRCLAAHGPYNAGDVVRRPCRAAAPLLATGKFIEVQDDPEPVDFTAIRGVSPAEAQKLANAGFRTFEQLAGPSEPDRRRLANAGVNRETEAAVRLLQESVGDHGVAVTVSRLRGGTIEEIIEGIEGVGEAALTKLYAAEIFNLTDLRNTPKAKLEATVGRATAEKLIKAAG